MSKNFILKRTAACLLSLVLVLSATATANAADVDKQTVKAVITSQHTDVYNAYLDGEVQVDENSGVKLAPYAVSASPLQPSSALPSSYKSRVTDVKNQGSYNTCWAFSAMGALESYLAVQGKSNRDLSEQHLAWWATKQFNSDGYGWQMNGLDVGGYSMTGTGYLASWQGAKSESDVPYLRSGNTTFPDNMDTAENAYNVTSIVYVENDITSVKTAVYRYGAVATSYNSGNGYNSDKSAYYQSGSTTVFSGHAIIIVGWDDNYSKTNFKASAQPPEDGAWLVKNSWGSSIGDDGYLWVSYCDRYILDTNTWGANYSVTGARTANVYDKLYQNEEYGATYTIGLYDDESDKMYDNVTFVNCFDFDGEHDILEEVIFEAENLGAEYTVYYIPVQNNEPVNDKSQWTKLASGTVDATGYISADANAYSLPSGSGAIGVTIDTAATNEAAYMGVDEWLTNANGEMIFKPKQKRNESFVIADGDVYDLVDIYAAADDDIGGTLVIKALATSNIIGDVNFDGKITVIDSFAVQRFVANFTDATGDAAVNADVNYDGKITVLDAFAIMRRAANMTDMF